MTKTAPARLLVLFAPDAPVAVIYRHQNGRKKWTQMWLWETDTDMFIPGQWIKGRIHDDSTLSPDGRYVISRVMSGEQHTVLSRPPYFTALAVTVESLCLQGRFFTQNGAMSSTFDTYRAPEERCPIPLWSQTGLEGDVIQTIDNGQIKSGHEPAFGKDQRDRAIVVSQGRIGVVEGDTTRWLADLNAYAPESVPPPDWALEW